MIEANQGGVRRTPELATAAKAFDYDRYAAALLASASHTDDLLVLIAFAAELAAVPDKVTELQLGQIRLQWWREALQSPEAERTGHPLADRVRLTFRRHGIPVAMMLGLIDAIEFRIERQPMPDAQHFKAYLVKSEGALFNASARVLGREEAGLDAASEAAGLALGRARLVLGFAGQVMRKRVLFPLPENLLDRLEEADLRDEALRREVRELLASEADAAAAGARAAERLAASLPLAQRPVFLPVATVAGDMDRWKRLRLDPLREVARPRPMQHLWRMWRTDRRWGKAP
ncbi:MAG: hypothetical protein F9K44_03915 [Hyphomicrobiaceae bacterium]|nr:MAG: hypothetical protein F9K44_03915 [Hyphomicrobiaceae bacterium]